MKQQVAVEGALEWEEIVFPDLPSTALSTWGVTYHCWASGVSPWSWCKKLFFRKMCELYCQRCTVTASFWICIESKSSLIVWQIKSVFLQLVFKIAFTCLLLDTLKLKCFSCEMLKKGRRKYSLSVNSPHSEGNINVFVSFHSSLCVCVCIKCVYTHLVSFHRRFLPLWMFILSCSYNSILCAFYIYFKN